MNFEGPLADPMTENTRVGGAIPSLGIISFPGIQTTVFLLWPYLFTAPLLQKKTLDDV